ncbi:MAG: helix-turn-helix domain-containing protein [Pseudomonas sp.]|jgi:two-component system OmpR family response regulator|uniref:winged helix-turn-helix domain-containing protein n=1 Tax=Pseudomonas TaxID=286 RepID=UPI00098A8D4F|nr:MULTISPECIES: helix-turn-helix domain-containing protein [Pseudomonas]MBU0523007.1 helix-turn-helix domain-containing protein [Gammaproteobacteria bacterium]MBU0821640.1 helix-turn-helix domain-containing protein [Gammaproteobacteria bacterium]MBU0845508.1 helix-turn-helix domain-containing protein [Gammaproteobacteria bacterium]MBU1839734.1 helix-turn-helix domain-containing protein [Gammaproteobacteria bacterium]MDO8402322.1 helix-turn-helix domain-containing protein [Pseudomonas sp.]
MESSTPLPRKYFVVVTHSPALQLELEALLSSERYNSFGTSQAKMFVEGVALPSSAPKLMEFISPHLDRIVPPVIRHDTQRILSSFESEWRAAQSDTQFSNISSRADEDRENTQDSLLNEAVKPHYPYTEAWRLSHGNGALIKDDVEVVLTGLEATLVKKMLHHDERVVSKDDLIRSIGREPEHYRGLEMCLSRLQEKFKSASNGERLFRAVRNRGYCLIQKIVRGKSLT